MEAILVLFGIAVTCVPLYTLYRYYYSSYDNNIEDSNMQATEFIEHSDRKGGILMRDSNIEKLNSKEQLIEWKREIAECNEELMRDLAMDDWSREVADWLIRSNIEMENTINDSTMKDLELIKPSSRKVAALMRDANMQAAEIEESTQVAEMEERMRDWYTQVAEIEESTQLAEMEERMRDWYTQVAEREEGMGDWDTQSAEMEEGMGAWYTQAAETEEGMGTCVGIEEEIPIIVEGMGDSNMQAAGFIEQGMSIIVQGMQDPDFVTILSLIEQML